MKTEFKNTLFLIPARGGSKGIPGKNIKPLHGKPLMFYSIDVARKLASDENICVSTDSDEIINLVQSYGLNVPFKRPDELSTDQAGSYEVILHAVNYFESKGKVLDTVVLLQPTSPFRTAEQISDAYRLYSSEIDMVVSVCESDANPYYNLFEEDSNGHLRKVIDSKFERRQDCPTVYKYNGAIYIINVKSLKKNNLNEFKAVRKYIMDKYTSVDIDEALDWTWAEFILEKGLVKKNA